MDDLRGKNTSTEGRKRLKTVKTQLLSTGHLWTLIYPVTNCEIIQNAEPIVKRASKSLIYSRNP